MSLRAKLLAYLAVVHAGAAALAVSLFREEPVLLIGAELLLVGSFALGARLVGRAIAPLDLVGSATELMRAGELTTRLVDVGQPEVDALLRLYNRLVDQLREERVRLEEQHRFVEKLLAASPSGVVTLDFDGRVAGINPAAARMLEVAPGPAAGRRLDELPGRLAAEAAGVRSGEARVVALPGGPGGRRLYRCRRGELIDRGHPRGFLMFEELTEELRRTEKAAYERLVRIMSHEINNTLGAVGSIAQSLGAYAPALPHDSRDDYVRALEVVRSRSAHLAEFLRGFAEVVRVPAPDLRPLDLRELAAGVVALMAGQLAERRIEVAWEIGEPTPVARLDRGQMEQVLVNVLKNAMEAIAATGSPGRIVVRIGREAPGGAFLEVEDSGPGLPAEAAASLFTPFFSTKRDGQGLGLALVQEILLRHGFPFSLETPPGGPSRFRIAVAS